MSAFCFLIDDLPLPNAAEADSTGCTVWPVATALAAAGDEVTLVQLRSGKHSTTDLNAAATARGVRYVALESHPGAFDVPLFPAASMHAVAYKVARFMAGARFDVGVACDCAAAVAIAALARATGVWAGDTRLVLWVHELPRELARWSGRSVAAGSRDALVHDFLERRAFALADGVVAPADLHTALSQGGFAANTGTLTPEPTSPADWRALAQVPRAVAPPATPPVTVSVCVPYYEQPAFLEEALEGLANQSLAPLEVIVWNDGSVRPDSVAAFTAAEQRYRDRGWLFLSKPNAGPAAARNRMAELARGDCLLFCDADNRFRPGMIATLVTALQRTSADAVSCAFQAFRSPGENAADGGYVFAPLGPCPELAVVENVLGDTNFLIRREVFRALGGFPENNRAASEDWQFLLTLLRSGRRLETVPAVLFEYRLTAGSHARRNTELASAATATHELLATSDPLWRRLWPHLVAAIRNPQVHELEHKLEAQRLEHLADRAALQEQLSTVRNALRRRTWEIEMQKSVVERAEAARDEAIAAKASAEQQIAERDHALRETRRERDASLAARDDKIRRMQESWSWKVTAPLRILRRLLIDPIRRSKAPSVPRAAEPAPHCSVDRPLYWDSAPASGTFSGWCLSARHEPLTAVRALVDGSALPGQTGLIRPDVAKAHQLSGTAAQCGFEFHYRLAPEHTYRVHIEAQTADGVWHLLRDDQLATTSRPREARDYAAWVQAFSTLTPDKAAALKQRLDALPPARRPLVSVLMPVYNPAEKWLVRAIESVREQVYENWELCIADDASPAPHVRAVLERFQSLDPRIRVTFRAENGHISAASNSALALVRGEFVALLDHDDELPPDALAEVVLELAAHPAADVIYSDEDKMDEAGRRHTPYFKPDYLPDLLLGQNCISHLTVYRASLVRDAGGFRIGYEGSQDWDLALRVLERTTPDRVRHIAKILYHWRAVSGSTAVAVSAKNYSVDSARRALLDHFARRGISAEVRNVPGDHWQVVRRLPDVPPLVSIIVPTKNAARLVRTCVGSIFARTEYPRYEILIVNNRSDDPAALELFAQLSREENVRVLDYDAPFNFSAINNAAARQARGDVLCFLNNDIEVITGRWLDELASHALRPEIGAVGAMLYYPDNTIQHAGVILGLGGVANHAFLHYPHGTDGYMNRARLAQNYSAVTAACLAVRRGVFEQVGGFDEKNLAVAFNDIDLCLRIRAAGYWNLWTPFAELYHHESASRGNDHAPEHQSRFTREIEYMRRTWGPLLDRDPAYNPNLSVDLLGWHLAWPPRT